MISLPESSLDLYPEFSSQDLPQGSILLLPFLHLGGGVDGVASESKGGENCRWVTESVHQFSEHFYVIRANLLIKRNFHELWDERQKYKVHTQCCRDYIQDIKSARPKYQSVVKCWYDFPNF